MLPHEAALVSKLADLARSVEALQRHWGDPLDERSALRRALRAELLAQRRPFATGPGDASCAPVAPTMLGLPAAGGRDGGGSAPGGPDLPKRPAGCGCALAVGGSASGSSAKSPLDLPTEAQEANGVAEGSHEAAQLPPCGGGSSSTRPLTAFRRRARLDTDITKTPSPKGSGWIGSVRSAMWKLTHRHAAAFDSFIGLVIVANSICVGVELQCQLEGSTSCVNIARSLEHFFLVVFILELIARVLSDGRGGTRNRWFQFDCVLVILGVISSWVLDPIGPDPVDSGNRVTLELLDRVLIFRVLRLARLVRVLRLFDFEHVHEMYKLASGLMNSLRTVTFACMLIVLTVYMFACFGIELITRNHYLLEDPVTADVVETHFPTLQVTMLTLVQFTNADSIAAVYQPLVQRAWYLVFYFGLAWLIIPIKLMNLITAVIVDSAITQGEVDREIERSMKRRRLRDLTPHLKVVFQELLEKAGTARLSLSDFRSGLECMGPDEMKQLPADLRKVLDSDQLVEVCEYIDADGSGVIDEQEFVDGVFSLVLQSVPIETTQMLQLLRSHSNTLDRILRRIHPSRRPTESKASTGPWEAVSTEDTSNTVDC